MDTAAPAAKTTMSSVPARSALPLPALDLERGARASAHVPDWSRETKRLLQWAPSRSLMASIRAYQRHAASGMPWARPMRRLCVLRHRFWSVVTGADIPLNSKLGGGLMMIHPNGIVIHPRATIGPNCLIFQQVTIGTAKGEDVPTVGAHVEIGAGARILGGVVIGDHAKIGANAVVLCDVPAGATAVGVPARVIDPASAYRPDNHLQTVNGSC